MSPIRSIGVLIVVASFVAGRGLQTPVVPAAEAPLLEDIANTTAIPEMPPQDDRFRNEDLEESAFDLFGNEVDEAVGDYRLDVRGDIYERHSPETEVPKLGPAVG